MSNSTTKNPQPLGPIAIVLYTTAVIMGLISLIAYIWMPAHPLIALPAIFSIPCAERLHANYFRRIR